ncbi:MULTISPECIES: hypothetical protein [unclassified Variovorax]|uniref:hypothetical protein n=1 Tax=unclassified Variovorax TaxID=663243 RepID=UPI0011AFCDCA|nr:MULTISPECIES: hypothetical protein [unclassified Variovorax]
MPVNPRPAFGSGLAVVVSLDNAGQQPSEEQMATQTQTVFKTQVLQARREVNYRDVAHGIVVYKDHRICAAQPPADPSFKAGFEFNTTTEGFAREANLLDHLNTGAPLKDFSSACFVDDEVLRAGAVKGFSGMLEALQKTARLTKPYSCFVSGDANSRHLVRIEMGSHQVFTMDGLPRPMGIHFDYIVGMMDNRSYDLELALHLLEANPRVHFETDRSGRKLQNIPSYNAEDGRTQCLEFIFEPTVEEAVRIRDWHLARDTKRAAGEEHEAIFVLDLLGLRKAGAARFDTYAGVYD